jgi:hypothetical protein
VNGASRLIAEESYGIEAVSCAAGSGCTLFKLPGDTPQWCVEKPTLTAAAQLALRIWATSSITGNSPADYDLTLTAFGNGSAALGLVSAP